MDPKIRELLDMLWVQFDEIIDIVRTSDDLLSNTAAIQLLHFKCERMEQSMAHLYVAEATEHEYDEAKVKTDMERIDSLRRMYVDICNSADVNSD